MLLSTAVNADVNSDLNDFSASWALKPTPPCPMPGKAKPQAMPAAALFMRTAVKQVQLFSMQVPSLNAGCGGIDAYLGSFSPYHRRPAPTVRQTDHGQCCRVLFDLALQTTVPEMKQAKDFLQKLASDVNSMNMSSCQAAQGIVGGLWPKLQSASRRSARTSLGNKTCSATGPPPARAAPSVANMAA